MIPFLFALALPLEVQVPMRDGIRLATTVSLPSGDGKFPTILVRTPYSRSERGGFWQEHGYAFVVQSVRGRYGSEGHWRLLDDDARDGADTARWIAAQPWSDQRIATIGTSYEGGTQHALAVGGAPFVKAMIPVDAASNIGRYGIRHNGAFELRLMIWVLTSGGALPPDSVDIPAYLRGRPLPLEGDLFQSLSQAMRHAGYDEFWRANPVSIPDHIDEYADVPEYHVTGWYDSWSLQTANINYPLLSKAKKGPQRLIVGPWIHGGQERTYAGEAEFGAESEIDLQQFQLRWIEHFMKGTPVDEPPVRIFVMGRGNELPRKGPEGRVMVGGVWRDEQEWPLSRAVATPFYLHANGLLSRVRPPAKSTADEFAFDPADPVPTLGGNVSSSADFMWPGAFDQHCRSALFSCRNEEPLAMRKDVKVFVSKPLTEALEVTGPLVVELFAASTSERMDFTAKLVDVYPASGDFPGGVALNVGDGIVRVERRAANSCYRIEMYPTALVFAKGHRIRLDLSSSNFPRFDVAKAAAVNRIFHDAGRPSRIVLPVIPTGAGR